MIEIEHAGTHHGRAGMWLSVAVHHEVCSLQMHQKGSSEETDTVVARSLPKHRKGLRDRGRHHHSNCQSRCFIVEFISVWPSPSSYLPHYMHSNATSQPWATLYVTYVAFSLSHTTGNVLPLSQSVLLYLRSYPHH